MEVDSTAVKVLVQLMIPVPSCLTKEAEVTDPKRAPDFPKIYYLIGNASKSEQIRTQQACRPTGRGRRVVETDSPGGKELVFPKSGNLARS